MSSHTEVQAIQVRMGSFLNQTPDLPRVLPPNFSCNKSNPGILKTGNSKRLHARANTHTHISFHIPDTHAPHALSRNSLCAQPESLLRGSRIRWLALPPPSPLGPENMIPNRPPGTSIRGSRAKEFVKRCSWKGFAENGFEACPGPTADRLGELPPSPGRPPRPRLPAAWLLAASSGTDRQSGTGSSWGWEPAESQAGMREKPVQR